MRPIAFIIVAGLGLVQAWSQAVLTPSSPAISPSPVFVPGSPALTTSAIPGVPTTNATLAALSDSLLALQANLQQTLPVVISFNDNFDFVSLAESRSAFSTASPPGNFSANMATNFASNFAVSAAVPTGASLFNTAPNRPATTVAGVSQGTVAGASQGFATLPMSRDALHALLVLQSDIQRMLPVLNALNGGTTSSSGSLTNLFGLVSRSP